MSFRKTGPSGSIESDQGLKDSNLITLLYALSTRFEDHRRIKWALLALAQEGQQPEAWMALAMIAHTEQQSDLQEKYIEQLKTAAKPTQRSIFSRGMPSEKAVCNALLLCDARLIKVDDDARHVRDFITAHAEKMRVVRGLESDNEIKPNAAPAGRR